jgi:hypothetical protein
MYDLVGQGLEAITYVAVIEKRDPWPNSDGTTKRVDGQFDFLALLETEGLHHFNWQCYRQRAAGLDE